MLLLWSDHVMNIMILKFLFAINFKYTRVELHKLITKISFLNLLT